MAWVPSQYITAVPGNIEALTTSARAAVGGIPVRSTKKDNASSNDICVNEFLILVKPDILSRERPNRRLRCWGHIFNLVVKAFLFGSDPDTFEADIRTNRTLDHLKEELQAWRKKGPIGKLYNVIVFIRRTSQRRQLF